LLKIILRSKKDCVVDLSLQRVCTGRRRLHRKTPIRQRNYRFIEGKNISRLYKLQEESIRQILNGKDMHIGKDYRSFQ